MSEIDDLYENSKLIVERYEKENIIDENLEKDIFNFFRNYLIANNNVSKERAKLKIKPGNIIYKIHKKTNGDVYFKELNVYSVKYDEFKDGVKEISEISIIGHGNFRLKDINLEDGEIFTDKFLAEKVFKKLTSGIKEIIESEKTIIGYGINFYIK